MRSSGTDGLAKHGQDHMRLAAVMGLVVEEMRKRRRQPLRHGAHVGDGHIGEAAGERLFAERADPVDDALVLGLARAAQLGEIDVEDRVQRGRRVALAGEALHPDAVGHEYVVQRAAHRLEEGAGVAAELFLASAPPQLRRSAALAQALYAANIMKCCFTGFPSRTGGGNMAPLDRRNGKQRQ